MPVVTTKEPLGKRRAPVWALVVPAGIALLLVGVFGWSWSHPVALEADGHGVGFGYGKRAEHAFVSMFFRPRTGRRPRHELHPFTLPASLGDEPYFVWWY
jgi:hypothetical protein